VSAYEDEHRLFDATLGELAERGSPLDLSHLLARMSATPDEWTRRRITAEEASTVGQELWAALPPHVRDPLLHISGPARLKIAAATPYASDLPWEWLNDGSGEPFALRDDFVLARTVPLRFPVHPLSVEPPLRVLLLVPNPEDERLLNADIEIEDAKAALPPLSFDVRVLDVPDFDGLAAQLDAFQPHVMHYVGHGGLTHAEGNLVLQSASGGSRWVSASELALVLPSSVRLLSLATPVTAENYEVLGLTHLARGSTLTVLPTSVAMQYPVAREVAREFWTAFYSTLLESGNANTAVREARLRAAGTAPEYADWGSFTLVVRDQTGVCFEFRSSKETAERRPAELRAQFIAEAANELAQQVQALGGEIPDGLIKRYEVVQERLDTALDKLMET
jgi:CHAT domain